MYMKYLGGGYGGGFTPRGYGGRLLKATRASCYLQSKSLLLPSGVMCNVMWRTGGFYVGPADYSLGCFLCGSIFEIEIPTRSNFHV